MTQVTCHGDAVFQAERTQMQDSRDLHEVNKNSLIDRLGAGYKIKEQLKVGKQSKQHKGRNNNITKNRGGLRS